MGTTQNTGLREQLKSVKGKIDEARQERADAITERDSAKEKLAGEDLTDPSVFEGDDFKSAEQAVAKVGKVEDRIADLKTSEATILGLLGEGSVLEPGVGDAGGHHRPGGLGGQTLSSLFSGDEFDALKRAAQSTGKLGAVALGEWMGRDRVADAILSAPNTRPRMESAEEEALVVGREDKVGATPADRRGFVPPTLKRLTLLDLIPFGTTDSSLMQYVQVVNLDDEEANEVADGAAKERLGLTTVDAEAPVKTIAGYVKLKKPALEDVAGLQSTVAALIPYYVRKRLEKQILSGAGTGEELKGLFHTSGIGAPAAVKFDNTADAILRALTTVILTDADPNFVALHPVVWQELLLMRWTEKEAEGGVEREGGYLYGSPSALPTPTIWGLAMTVNRGVPEATPLVGDSNAAMIAVRQGMQLLVSDNDGDDFTRNRVTVLGEMRAAFPVWRPASFAKANLG